MAETSLNIYPQTVHNSSTYPHSTQNPAISDTIPGSSTYPHSSLNSPDSSCSTSKLLPRKSNSEFNQASNSQNIGNNPRKSFSLSRCDERQNTRIFIRRMPSPFIGKQTGETSRTRNVSYSSDNVFHNHYHHHYHIADESSSDVFLPHDEGEDKQSSHKLRGGSFTSTNPSRFPFHSRTSSLGSMSYLSRTSSFSDVVIPLSLRQSELAQEAMNAPRVSRSSTRRSLGQEWTLHHWHQIKDLEEESERSRRCSKLSSGFAPLMVFGGLVFVCIGISATTNTGKDQDKLKQLSAAPLAMGVFMILLGASLILTWIGCRSRAKRLDQKLLHGSCENVASPRDTLVQTIVAKLYNQIERVGLVHDPHPQTSSLSGITVDGVMEHKTPPLSTPVPGARSCSRCRPDPFITRETSL